MENNNKNQKSNNNGLLGKAAIIGVVAGLIGGGVSYYGIDQLNQAQTTTNQAQTSISSSSAKVSRCSCFCH